MEPKDRDHLAAEWLDAALKQYGEAEPRSGLEGRVLATLRVERERRATNQWRWWPALAVLAVVVLIGGAIFLARRPDVTAPTSATNRADIPVAPTVPERSIASHDIGVSAIVRPAQSGRPHRSLHVAHETRTPHLDQFPSPEPLSEQEKILADYVRNFGHEAVLLARAQSELLKREALEQKESSPRNETTTDLQQQGEPE